MLSVGKVACRHRARDTEPLDRSAPQDDDSDTEDEEDSNDRCVTLLGGLVSLVVALAAMYVALLTTPTPLQAASQQSRVLQHPETIDAQLLRQRLLETVVHTALPAHRYAELPLSFVDVGGVVYGLAPLNPQAFLDHSETLAPTADVLDMEAALRAFHEGSLLTCEFRLGSFATAGYLLRFPPNAAVVPQDLDDAVVVAARVCGQAFVWKWTRHAWAATDDAVVQEILPAFAQLASLRLRYPSYMLLAP
ncbi:hypothetical protein SPRG_02689 [Saprolegnia parasitica CBS 223.65]|uniref:Uncharacterized protein n=1 Tax=Saprolegnia parasitica (strain CBS 223.65) TaxID=695850 RepID=A0A067CR46_SAPPC|nr:hypothetical protein SPRG_02689 [Saprolegnia parasitica CBS 223.65]KDO32998.1 hypothetical protein SPRG_02689 [Saprolegnia parasitica CBS 223.65]|eukprot:XP_012196642.1 hypothetical protein SPRG_02689 [Saprolegnia parasitica CBS 223.65]